MKHRHPELFDFDRHMEKISNAGDPLEKLSSVINWEIFRPAFKGFRKHEQSNMGRPPYDEILMLKILILQQLYNLSDDQTEFMIRDRFSFLRFLGLNHHSNIPDAKTIWLFREKIKEAGLERDLFDKFTSLLTKQGVLAKQGSILDASFVEVPKQRNNREENQKIKNGTTPEEWKEKPHKLAQKDTDARWVKKNNQSYYGYKNHTMINSKSKLITDYSVTSACVHDSQPAPGLIKNLPKGSSLHADSAYNSDEISAIMKKRKIKANICSKGYRNRQLTRSQIRTNRRFAKVRARVEHVYGRMHNFGGYFIRTIGFARAAVQIGLQNLTYNIDRYRILAS